ncbi:MAG: RipA family octameric membrane protein [Halobacteriota archaeon]
MADRNSDRRVDANKFFISLLTGLIAVLSVVTQLHGPVMALNAMFIAIGVFGMLLCYVWYVTIRSYKQLNSGKFHLIGDVEAQLPYRFYDEEWNKLGRGKDKKRYIPITRVEQLVPILFSLIYAALFVIGAILLALNTALPL